MLRSPNEPPVLYDFRFSRATAAVPQTQNNLVDGLELISTLGMLSGMTRQEKARRLKKCTNYHACFPALPGYWTAVDVRRALVHSVYILPLSHK